MVMFDPARRPDRDGLSAPARVALAVDIGGTKFAVAIIGDGGEVLSRAQCPTPTESAPEEIGQALLGLVTLAANRAGRSPDLVGIGSAGPLDVAAGTVSPVNIHAWRGFGITELLEDFTGCAVVRLAGDGHCMAFGEFWASRHPSRAMLGMVVSTGVGGGIVIDGRPLVGPTGNAGHIGHMVVDADGPVCPCGGRGCLETLASGPSMVGWAVQQGWAGHSGTPSAADLARAARHGDPMAVMAFRRCADAIGVAVVGSAALFDLDDVIIGGGVADGAGDLLIEPIRARVMQLAGLEFVRRVRIASSTTGPDAGLLGAAAMAFQQAAS
jgi:glucokinase